ncbi:hypothetical protein IAT38_003234 [Cryptococcus sp. DSM 104549]
MAALTRRLFASCSRPQSSLQVAAAIAAPARFISSVPSLSSTSTPADSHPYRTSAHRLPGVIHRFIAHRLNVGKDTNPQSPETPIVVPNPFYQYRIAERATLSDLTGRRRWVWLPAPVNHRRQKSLLNMYYGRDLPRSADNPEGALEVEWTDGRIIQFETDVSTQTDKTGGPYAGRKVMFKGHKDEREKKAKEAERQMLLAGMEKRVDAWRKTRAADKVKARPTLPF